MKPLKPWVSFAQQLELLQARALEVEDRAAALDYLERLGYYRLSGYWYPLRAIDLEASAARGHVVRLAACRTLQSKTLHRQVEHNFLCWRYLPRKLARQNCSKIKQSCNQTGKSDRLLDSFVPGSRFEDVVRLYVFDKKLRLLALDALERIEMAVRVDVAHLLGQRDPSAHENPACLHGNFAKKQIAKGRPDAGKTHHQVWLTKYQSLLHRARKEPFVVHHQQQYGTLPIWAAVEVWDFGLLSKLFAGMQHADQRHIASLYGASDGQTFAQWLRSLNFIRNVSAHHSRLWNINVVERSAVPAHWPVALDNARPFFYCCLMRHLLGVICPRSTWGQRVADLLENDFPHTDGTPLSLADMGAFAGWADAAPWKSEH